jgi:hypothetical protein
MKRLSWQVRLGFVLVALSAVLYVIHFEIFQDAHHIFVYLLGDIAFVPIEVLFVTLIIHELLGQREKRILLEKMNMIIGVFFSEAGTSLLVYFSDFDPRLDDIRQKLIVQKDWSEKEFKALSKQLKVYDYGIEIEKFDLVYLRNLLLGKREFLLRLLENPNLLEHESFTELLRAVFHLTEELKSREDINSLISSDRQHLADDIRRIYVLLVNEWLDYMEYLRNNYPYLFSLAIRTNPFDLNASPEVK